MVFSVATTQHGAIISSNTNIGPISIIITIGEQWWGALGWGEGGDVKHHSLARVFTIVPRTNEENHI